MPRPFRAPGALTPHFIGLAAAIVAGLAIFWHVTAEPPMRQTLLRAADHIDYAYDVILNDPETSPDRKRELKILVEYRDYMILQASQADETCLADAATLLANQAQQLLDLAAPKEAGPIQINLQRPDIRSAEAKQRLADCPR